MRSLVFASLAVTIVAVACAPKSTPASSPAASNPPASAVAAPAPAPPLAATPAPAQAPPAAAPAAAAPPADEVAGGRGRGGRGGPPPPPPTPPPAVMPAPVKPIVSATAPSPDPRVGLAAGRWDAAQAAWNVRLVSTTPPWEKFLGVTSSDLAFSGKYAIQGNYNGFQIFDISNPAKPTLALTYLCPASQSDVSVYKNLLFVSGEGQTGRVDCGIQGVPEPVSKERLRGIRIFDISNMASPKLGHERADLPRLAHAHGRDRPARQGQRLRLCIRLGRCSFRRTSCRAARTVRIDDPDSARFRLEVIKVPLAAPQTAGDRELATDFLRSCAAAATRRAWARRCWRGTDPAAAGAGTGAASG